jgi:nucleotide-binding universal stress UspA family protein
MKNIIVAVDFSVASKNAANYALKLAGFYKANLILYNAYELPVTYSEYGYPFVNSAELQNAAEYQMQELLNGLTGESAYMEKIETKVELNNLMDGLESICEFAKADLVVMGITGKDALTRLLIGSNTIQAIHHLHCPVLIVPKGCTFLPFQKVGFAVDYTKPASAEAIGIVNSIVTTFKASLDVINVDWENRHFSVAAQDQQDLLHKQLSATNTSFHNLENEHIATAIHDFARSEKINLLVAMPKKHNLIEKLFTRSQSKELLYHTDMPVLCIPE